MSMTYWLSIDFDFFVYSDPSWDWQHREAPFFRDGPIWTMRAAGLAQNGDDYRQAMRRGVHTVSEFMDKVGHLDFTGANVVVTDSHAYGYSVFVSPPMPRGDVTLLHFDAHHDLGYRYATVHDHIVSGAVACDDWLLQTMMRRRRVPVQIVYPDWRGLEEWDLTRERREEVWRKLHVRRTPRLAAPTTLSSLPPLVPGKVERIHLCRSGAWSPPWMDADFIALVDRLAAETGRPAIFPYIDAERCHPGVPRTWDDACVAQFIDALCSIGATVPNGSDPLAAVGGDVLRDLRQRAAEPALIHGVSL